jgi:putative flippase GtrA
LSRLFDSIAGSPRVTRMLGQVQTRPRWRRLYLAIAGNRKEFGRFAKFATVGTVGTVVDFSVLNLLILGFGLTKFWANTWSFSAAVLSNFVWNRLWTFPESRERPLVPQLAQFGLVSVGG